jgi:hypothetical protein
VKLDKVREMMASSSGAVPMINLRSGKAALRIPCRSLLSEDGVPITRYELVRPTRREHLPCERLAETHWQTAEDAAFAEAWERETREAESAVRRDTVHLATGLLLPVWDKLPDDHVQVIRIAADDGRTLLGREIPAASLSDVGERLGLKTAIAIPVDQLAASVIRTGKPLPLRGPEDLLLRRALVNGHQRLELTGFSAARLDWYKAQGCFTEIIRYRTRLFVPVDRAPAVLSNLINVQGSN